MDTGPRSYTATLRRLEGLGRLGVRFGLERMASVMARLDQPQRRFAAVHLAGTNGKGSTAAMIAACLSAAGLRTGLYISPHLSRFTERIQIDGREVRQEQVVDLAARVLDRDEGLSFFEAVTAMAFLCFAEQGVELAVVETGLGGRLDATSVVQPLVCGLTRIALDHTDLLGERIEQVAREKAGILKPGVPAVSAPATEPGVEQVLAQRCARLGSELWWMERDFGVSPAGGSLTYQGPGWRVGELRPGLAGPFQRENAALCLAVLERLRRRGVRVGPEAARAGLAGVRWPGRMEWLDPRHLLDGAHNPCAARALAAALPPEARFSVVLGLLGVRDARQVLEPILPHAARVILTRPRSPRAQAPEQLARSVGVAGPLVAGDLPAALEIAHRFDDPVLITGSLYLVGEARSLLAGEPQDPVPTADPLPGPGGSV